MSGAEHSYRFALLAFPKQYREERGEEIVATVLEGGDSWRLREFLGLLFAGINQRGLAAGGERTISSVRAGIRLGAFALLWLGTVGWTVNALYYFFGYGRSVFAGDYWRVGLAHGSLSLIGLLALLALSRGWWVAPLALACAWTPLCYLASGWQLSTLAHPRATAFFALSYAPLLFASALLQIVARPRERETLDLRSPYWAVAALALAGLVWKVPGAQDALPTPSLMLPLFTPSLMLPLFVAVPVAWLFLGRSDIRLAVAGATVAGIVCLEVVAPSLAYPNLLPDYQNGSVSWVTLGNLIGCAFALFAAISIAVGIGGRRADA